MIKTKPPTIEPPKDAKQFSVTLKEADAGNYPYLSEHVFDGAKYRVTAVLFVADGVSVEFVRIQ